MLDGCRRRADRRAGGWAGNERKQAHIDYYLQRLEYWKGRKPAFSTARLLAARDADEANPLWTEEEATEVVKYLWHIEREQAASI